MRLISFGPRYEERPALLTVEDRILDLSAFLPGAPRSWREILDQDRLQEALALGAAPDPGRLMDLDGLRLAPPLPDPSKIVCLGLNYRDHAEEQNRPLPEKPLLFAKAPSALIGPEEPIILPANEPEVDWRDSIQPSVF